MKLKEILENNKTTILQKWFDVVVNTYPADTARFLKSRKDPFDNPVGNTTRDGLTGVFDEISGGMDCKKIQEYLDPIIRIRAIQTFTPTHAIGFVFSLKKIIRELKDFPKKSPTESGEIAQELFETDTRIDQAGLIAFDIYAGCREKLFEIKVNEQRRVSFSALERAGLIGVETENSQEAGV